MDCVTVIADPQHSTLTGDHDFQSPVSYGRDPFMNKNEGERSDGL